MCVCGDGEREREKERDCREFPNTKTRRVVPRRCVCIIFVRVSQFVKVRKNQRKRERKRERERGDMCVSACAGTIQRELPTTRTFCCKYEVTTSVFDAGRLRRLVTPLGVLPI